MVSVHSEAFFFFLVDSFNLMICTEELIREPFDKRNAEFASAHTLTSSMPGNIQRSPASAGCC